jgi:heat shock protein HtpX
VNLWKLRLSILGTLTVIIGLSTLFFTVILSLLGTFNIVTLVLIVVSFNIVQWLIAPYVINAIYRAREVTKSQNPQLHEMVERLSKKSGMKMPKVMVADIPVPNAFAYSSPLAGSRVAVTTGLLKTLEEEEIEAVIGHELGHLKHRDVQVMMFVSILPAIFYFIGYSMLLSSMFGRRDKGGGGAAVIGIASLFLYWVLTMFTLYLSRVREYFADRHSVSIVEEGPRKLSEGLTKIVYSTGRMKRSRPETRSFNSFKALFISDPDHAEVDAIAIVQSSSLTGDQKLVQEALKRKVTALDKFLELFSTHPNIVKRLRALQKLS